MSTEEEPISASVSQPRSRSPWIAGGRMLFLFLSFIGVGFYWRAKSASPSSLGGQSSSAALDHFWTELSSRSNRMLIVLPVVGSDGWLPFSRWLLRARFANLQHHHFGKQRKYPAFERHAERAVVMRFIGPIGPQNADPCPHDPRLYKETSLFLAVRNHE